MARKIIWHKLNERADYGATHGARIGRNTLLELPSGSVVIVGHMTCGNRNSALEHVQHCHPSDSDRRLSAATFRSWIA